MKEFLKMTGAVVAGLFVWSIINGIMCFIGFMMMISIFMGSSKETTKAKEIDKPSILKLDLGTTISERSYKNYSNFYETFSINDIETLGLNDIEKAIKKAKNDDNIKGLLVDASQYSVPDLATAQAIRNLIIDFKESGKPTYAYSYNYGNADYYVASACDKVVMRPMGDFYLKGLYSESMYYKGALEKFGIGVQVIRHGKFKAAVEPFLQETMSEANRLQISTYLNDMWEEIENAIAESRGIDKSVIDQHVNNIDMFSDTDKCVEEGFIDCVQFKHDFEKMMAEELDLDAENIEYASITDYNNSASNFASSKIDNHIAILYAVGEIVSKQENTECITSKQMVKDIDKAIKDDDIKAVVLRINSPGGDAVEAEIIYNKLLELKEKKPVVASMGGYAASGGYYIASPCDAIVAEPTTITGSIGVFGLLMNAEKLMKNTLGINIESVSTHKHSSFYSSNKNYPSDEIDIVQASVERTYDIFVSHVADGRNMSKENVDSIAQGRVWTGKRAIEIGLVDSLCGINGAIEKAAKLAGIDDYVTDDYNEMEDSFSKMINDLIENSARLYYGDEMYGQIKMLKNMKARTGVQAYMPVSKIQ